MRLGKAPISHRDATCSSGNKGLHPVVNFCIYSGRVVSERNGIKVFKSLLFRVLPSSFLWCDDGEKLNPDYKRRRGGRISSFHFIWHGKNVNERARRASKFLPAVCIEYGIYFRQRYLFCGIDLASTANK